MNLNDKNIDQLFRDAAQNSGAPRYDHSYWKEMNSILNDEDKRKRGFVLWSVAGSIVMALLVSTLFIINEKEPDLLLADNSSTSVNTVQNSQENETFDKINPSPQSEMDQVNTDESNNESNIDQSGLMNNDIEKAKQFGSTTKPEESLNTVPLEVESKTQVNSKENNSIESNHLVSKNEVIVIDSDRDEYRSIESLSPRMVQLEQAKVSNELVSFRLQKEIPINFYAKLSAGLMENYETSRPFQSGVFDLSLNIEYQKEQVLFRTGLGIQATSNADLVVSERAKVYGFGLTTHQNNLSYQSLYDMYIPIEIGYSLNNTSFGFGGQVNYMIRTTMNYESLENNIVVGKSKIKGFDEGLNSFTAQGYVWLEQKISNRFLAGIKIGTSLNSRIKEGRYFNESATTNPLYGQLTLRYNLNK